MRSPRLSPCINLRFANMEEMDRMELLANQDGLNLQNWLRRLARQELANKQFRQLIAVESIKSQFRIEAMIRSTVNEATVRMARESAEYQFSRLQFKSVQIR